MAVQEQAVTRETEMAPAATATRARWRWRPRLWMQWLHRWATLTLGVVLLVVTTTGSIALFEYELNQLAYPQYYRVSPGTPVSLEAARATVQQALAADPALADVHLADLVATPGRVYLIYLRDKDEENKGTAFVDPGTGAYLGHYKSDDTFWSWIATVHTTLLADKVEFTYPAWVPEWAQTAIGPNLGELMLKNMALLLLIMVITGAYLWWPGIKKMAYGLRVRRGAHGFVWHYDWHKVLGFVSLPFLCMWAITGLNFYEPWNNVVKWGWYSATFSTPPAEEAEDETLQSTPNGGPMISADRARDIALTTVPNTSLSSVAIPTVVTGTVTVWLAQGIDPYAYGEWPGQVNLQLDAYSGAVLDNSVTHQTNWAAYVFENWFGPTHFGNPVPWYARLIWFSFGMMPLFLAFTGMMQWWLKRQKRAKRRAAHQPTRAPAGGAEG